LLKLKRVEIHGFKSFYDRTEMKFNGHGIAAVVGPNGCGKSNLSDAMNWVLGEQSAKSLRGGRMEDVIFAGTRERKPLGMASVTMTLTADSLRPAEPSATAPAAASAEEAPQEKGAEEESEETATHEKLLAPVVTSVQRAAQQQGEITITRRLYRSGESEYLINGKPARLRDIQDLFLGTGLGPESYAIIEQGRIGQILSNRPQDRRAVIEEAAGITKFKTRKRLAEAKLEGAKQNLSRVFDILEEVTRQVNSLKRQAAKTKRFGELKAEMLEHLRQVLAAKFKLLERELAKTAIELNLANSELQAIQAEIGAQEEQQATVIQSSYSIEADLTEARKQLADLRLEAEKARGRLEYQSKQVERIEARLAVIGNEGQQLEKQQGELSAELEQQNGELSGLEQERAAVRANLDAKAAERQQAQANLSEREKGLEALRQQTMRLLGESSTLKNRVSQTEAQLAGLERETDRSAADERQSESDLTRIKGVREEISERLTARQTQLVSVTEQRREIEQSLQAKRAELDAARQSLEKLRSEFSRIKARKDSLQEVISHRSYTTETVKRLFNNIAKGQADPFTPVGVLADFIEVDPQYEKAAEEFLHEELEYVVVRDWADAERGVDLLRGGLDGRATFIVEKLEEGAVAVPAQPPVEPTDGLIGKLADALRFSNGLSQAPLQLLPRVANCYLTADRATAQSLASKYPALWFLAADGISYHGQSVSGGKKSSAGPLALKRELRELSYLEKEKGQHVESTTRQVAELDRDIRSLAEQLEILRQQQQAQEKDVLALDHETRKLAEEFQRASTRLSAARLELERIGREREKLDALRISLRAELDDKESKRREAESALEEERLNLQELQSVLARVSEEHSTLRASLAGFEERHRAVLANRQRIESRLAELTRRRESLVRERESLGSEQQQLTANNAELVEKNASLEAAMGQVEARVSELAKAETEIREQISTMEEVLKQGRQKAQVLQDTRAELQVSIARMESDRKYLEETSVAELQTPLAELAAAFEVVPDAEELASLDAKYQDLRRKIEALGPVNPEALKEYEEAQQRYEFLNAQRQDLLDSIRDTEKAIQDLDAESRRRFVEAFQVINANFTEMFKTLFGGGVAEMRLTDEENVSESGIDIVASPPGKRLQSVLLLSGGEKALTAMALLMAVFQYTPSPFCILDEIDAPLDEPNIQRLTKLLAAMSEQTQFIVITHAKRTMEAAQALYGVTMQEPGVSKLVSVKFNPVSNGQPLSARNEGSSMATAAAKEQERELVMA
jgi:chromosome segregation protein